MRLTITPTFYLKNAITLNICWILEIVIKKKPTILLVFSLKISQKYEKRNIKVKIKDLFILFNILLLIYNKNTTKS